MNNMLEKMYTDFVTNMLPKVSEGLMITKEYFTDLFGRYVQYLIVMDSITILFGIILVSFAVAHLLWGKREHVIEQKQDYYRRSDFSLLLFFIAAILAFSGIFTTILGVSNLIKSVYIPEVRIYEEIKLRM